MKVELIPHLEDPRKLRELAQTEGLEVTDMDLPAGPLGRRILRTLAVAAEAVSAKDAVLAAEARRRGVEKSVQVRQKLARESALRAYPKIMVLRDLGASMRLTAAALNDDRVPTVSGKGRWHPRSVWRVIHLVEG